MLSNLPNLYKKYDAQISKRLFLHVEKTVKNRLFDF
jgi:hypothetical protein